MVCGSECWGELGPPPDMILRMPPPPLPAFLGPRPPLANLSGPPCRPSALCEPQPPPDKLFPGVEYVELPHHDSSTADDTWLLVLVTSCVAVLLLGAMLALLLLKCRETYTFHFSDNSATKSGPLGELAGPLQSKARPGAPQGAAPPPADNRALWAALTPRGTQHFIADIYPQDCVSPDMYREEDHYETVEAVNYNKHQEKLHYPVQIGHYEKKIPDKASFDNSGFIDYEYEDPTLLLESYRMDEMESCYREPDPSPYCIVNQLPMEGVTLRRGGARPLVSSPTHIEHPNMPPLNLHPHRNGGNNQHSNTATLRKPVHSHSRRVSDSNSYNGNINI